MAFHPVIAADHVIVADSHAVVAYALQNGKPSVWFDAARELVGLKNLPEANLSASADPRYTLTVDSGRVYARLGVQDLNADRSANDNISYLVCLNLERGETEKRLRWVAKPDETQRGALFEGAPVVHDGRVYIAATRVDGGQTITAIHCYPADCDGPPQALWRRDVCTTQELRNSGRRYRHHLLTLADSRIIYCSHSGAIVALDAETGKNVWGVRYPGSGNTTRSSDNSDVVGWERDLAPCLYFAGRLFAAPADDKRLLCLDPMSGATLWERGGVDIVHMLGAARERFIFTTPQSIRAVEPATGKDIWQMPDVGTSLAPAGRGLLADDLVLWPTSHGLKVLRTVDGLLSADFPPAVLDDKFPPERLGNMVYADGCLAIAGPQELAIFLAPGRKRLEREAAVRAQPNSSEARLELALAQEDAGFPGLALVNLLHAEKIAKQKEAAGQVRNTRHALLVDLARAAESRHDWTEASRLLESASTDEFESEQQAKAIVHSAMMWSKAQNWPRALGAWQAILDKPALRFTRVEVAPRLPQNAAVLATIQIDNIIKRHGIANYSPIEELARKQLGAAGKDRQAALGELAARFPNATVIRAALKEWDAALNRGGHNSKAISVSENNRFSLPLMRAWEVSLASSEQLLTPVTHVARSPTIQEMFTGVAIQKGGRLICRDSSTGSKRWSASLPFVPRWISVEADVHLAGGAGGVARLHLGSGRVQWVFPSSASFSAFRSDGSRLFLLENLERLIAVDAATGEVQWTRWAPGAGLGVQPPSGRFNPHFFLGSKRLLIQTGGGQIWLLDSSNGKTVQELAGSPRQWTRSPLPMDEKAGRVCLAVQPHRIEMLDLESGMEAWHYDLPHRGTLTGELPQLVGDGRSLFLLVPRNFGTGHQRLDPVNGYPLWPEERRLTHETLTSVQLAFDDRAIYFVAGDEVHARNLADGRALWALPLPGLTGSSWRLLRIGDALLAAPRWIAELRPSNPGPIEWPALFSQKPLVPRDERPAQSLFLMDPQTGQLMQRLNLFTDVAESSARKLLKEDRQLTFYFSSSGLTVGVPGNACLFVPAETGAD
jgi:outer membrane protein assembly factor BamB